MGFSVYQRKALECLYESSIRHQTGPTQAVGCRLENCCRLPKCVYPASISAWPSPSLLPWKPDNRIYTTTEPSIAAPYPAYQRHRKRHRGNHGAVRAPMLVQDRPAPETGHRYCGDPHSRRSRRRRLAELPVGIRSLVESHFLDGESVVKIQRQRQSETP